MFISGYISGTSQNIKLVNIAGLFVGISVVGLAWIVWKGETSFLIGILLGLGIEFFTIRKYGLLQRLRNLQKAQ